MTFSIPISAAMREALKDQSKRYIKISIIHNGETVSLYPLKLSGNVSEEFQSWNVQLKNYGEYTEGLFADDLVTVSFSHDNSDWITMMTGYVSPEGMTRENGYVSDDFVSFDLVDRTKGKGTRRKPSSTVFAALKICDPSDVSNSILHRLGSLMGISSFDIGLIQDVKDIVVLGEQVVWSELKLLRDAYKASMYFDHLGRLRFHSPLEIGWTDPESEWAFVADPSRVLDNTSSRVVGKVRRTYNQVSCNRAKTTLNLFEKRSNRVIYRDTTNWNSDLSQCSIVIQPGETYPESGVLSLSYKDPDTGEEYSYATNVQTPSIGQSKSYDICYTGGRLSLVSFNGSSEATTQQPDASQIILKNTGSLSCEIIKFEVKGEPFLKLSENNIEELDSSVSDDVDYVDLSIDGKYATSVSQIDKVLARHVEEGKNRTRHFSFSTTFLPHIQREMRCTFVDVDGSETLCKITTYSHKQSGRTLDSMRTAVELDEVLSYTPTYNPKVVTKNPQPSVPIQGKPGDKMIIQFALGDSSAPFDTGWTLGQDEWEIGQDDWVVGQDTWVDNPPTPGEGQYVWQRVGYYNPSTETWPSDWKITRSTGLKGDQGPQGLQGLQGPQGDQGIQGPVGEDGLTAYNHIAYADDVLGSGFSQDPTGKPYIGFYADHTATDSTNPADYAWSLIKGADGEQGIPGPSGEDGLTAYFHTAWSNSADGAVDFSTTVSAGKTYIGTYSDNTQADSTDPADYAWVLIKGATGDPARAITLYADSNVISLTSRGVLKTQQIELTCAPSNLPIESAVWTATDAGSLSEIEIAPGVYDQYKRILDCSLVSGDSTLITVVITYGGNTYTAYVGLSKVKDGLPAPQNFHGVASVPSKTALDEPLVKGDYFLWSASNAPAGATVDPVIAYPALIKGEIYEYNGTSWVKSSNGDLVMTMFDSIADLPDDVDSSVMGLAVIKKLVAVKGWIDELFSNYIEIKQAIYAGYSKEGEPPSSGKGFYFDKDGALRAVSAELVNAVLSGMFTSQEFSTQKSNSSIINISKSFSFTHYILMNFAGHVRSEIAPLLTNEGPVGDFTEAYTINTSGLFLNSSYSQIKYYTDYTEGSKTIRFWYYTLSGGVLALYYTGSAPSVSGIQSIPSYAASSYRSTINYTGHTYDSNDEISFLIMPSSDFPTVPSGSFEFTGTISYSADRYGNPAGSITSSSQPYKKIAKIPGAIVVQDADGQTLKSFQLDTYVSYTSSFNIAIQGSIPGIKVMNAVPASDSTYSIGTNEIRFAHGYFDDLHSPKHEGYPMYTCRAWGAFNGVGGISYLTSKNVSYVERLGIGQYKVVFSTEIPRSGNGIVEYSIVACGAGDSQYGVGDDRGYHAYGYNGTTCYINTSDSNASNSYKDVYKISFAVFA